MPGSLEIVVVGELRSFHGDIEQSGLCFGIRSLERVGRLASATGHGEGQTDEESATRPEVEPRSASY